jgi:hypothetical protein
MNKINGISKFIMILVVLTGLFVFPAANVEAGTNGQHLRIAACNAVRVVIKGTNSTGTSVTYTLNKSATACGFTSIPSLWWKGKLTATAYYNVTTEYLLYKGESVSVTVPTQQSNSNYYAVTIATPSQRDWMLWRAQTWVTDHVAYNQSSTHDGYRQDCSGYVSFVWQLTKPGTSPNGISSYANQIPFDSLKPGDVLNNPSTHTMLFVKWVDQSAGTFVADQESNPKTGTQQITLTLNKSTGQVIQNSFYTYPGFYKAMRLKGL